MSEDKACRKLEPCPFCGSTDISEGEVLTTWGAGGTATQSMCNECGALGPEAKLPEGEVDYGDVRATAAWNRRWSRAAKPAVPEWQPIETAPQNGDLILLAAEFDRPGDWRIKVGGYWESEWHVFGASWIPTRWMPLPAAPTPPETAKEPA